MKKIAVLMAACAVLLGAWAETWTDLDTGYTWTYRINGDTADIVGSRDYYSSSYSVYHAAISPEPNGKVVVPAIVGLPMARLPVTSVGYCAFARCNGLTDVVIPDGVTNIGHYAFYECSGLTNVTIPDGVTSIGDWAFRGCSGLTSVTIPDSVTSIGEGAFS